MKILTPNPDYMFEFDDEGLSYTESRDTQQVVKEAWVENVYQIEPSDFHSNNVFVDIGANIGAVSVYVASFNDQRSENEQIKVFAYEPEPRNLKLLSKNIKINKKVQDIRIVTKAVSGADSGGKSFITDQGGNSRLVTTPDQVGSSVEVISLDQVFTDNQIKECDVLKMDIEGSEYPALIECETNTLLKIKYLTLEFTGGSERDFAALVTRLAEYFNLHIIGRPSIGGYIYGRRY